MKGSKRQRPSGAWELRVYAGTDPVTNKEQVLTRTFRGGVRQADAALREFVGEIEAGRLGGTEATVRALLARWVRHLDRLDRSPTTMREYRRIIERTINPAIGDYQLRRLTAKVLDDLYEGLSGRGLAPASVRQVHSVIRAALGQAVKWDYLPSNPAEKATPPPMRQRAMKAPTTEQVRAILAEARRDDPELAVLIALAVTTGARRGELCGLRWGDVDWTTRTLTISRSVAVMGRGKLIVKGTKTHATRRIALDDAVLAILKFHRARAESLAGDLDLTVTDDAPLISYDSVRPIGPDTASHYVRAVAKRVGVDTHLHALRHYAASELVAAGTNIRTVAGVLGHRDPGLTLRVYSHQLEDREREAASVLGRALMPPA